MSIFRGWYRVIFLVSITLTILKPAVAVSTPSTPERKTGALVGEISDLETGEKLGWSTLLIEELNRSLSAHADGSFHFFRLPVGRYTLKTFRVGYQTTHSRVNIQADDTTKISIGMKSVPVTGDAIIVEAYRLSQETSDLQQPVITVSGKILRQNLGTTIAETIEEEPGLSTRSMGPAPARPVLRGLSGDRLLILEDGGRTGDLSASSSDHAVVIEPLTAERIEVIRGPEALKFGGNTLGGVVNVVRNFVPTTHPHRISGTVSLNAQSVNSGYSGGAEISGPLGPIGIRMDGSYRSADNMNTPNGPLLNTGIENLNGSIGGSYFKPWGYIGAAGGYYDSEYGIPPDPFGGHPKGVNIDLQRTYFESKGELYPRPECLCRFNFKYGYSRYQHTELEANGAVGIKFGVLTHHLTTTLHTGRLGVFQNGTFGLWGEYRDYATAGLSFTPPTLEYSLAGFVYQESYWGNWGMNGTVRYDLKAVRPSEEKNIVREDFILYIRDRSFQGFSFSLSTVYQLHAYWRAGLTATRSFRAPGIEELFSEGPHLAAYAYEVGNSELGDERGTGLETFLELKRENSQFKLAIFHNNITGFTYPENTGRLSLRRADLFLYQYVGKHVAMSGFESTLNWYLSPHWSVGGNISFVTGRLVDPDAPLYQIPPLEGKFRVSYSMRKFSISGHLHFAGRQDRLGEFENLYPIYDAAGNPLKDEAGDYVFEQKPTEGYAVVDLVADYYFSLSGFLHTLSLSMENIANIEYRNHLNRVKQIMPEAGRNIKVLYKIYF